VAANEPQIERQVFEVSNHLLIGDAALKVYISSSSSEYITAISWSDARTSVVMLQTAVSRRAAMRALLLLLLAVDAAALTVIAVSAVAKTTLRPAMIQTSSNSHKVAIVKGGKLASVDVRLHQKQPLAAAATAAARVLLAQGQPSMIDTEKADADAQNEVVFQDILLALQLFKEQHSHLRIPEAFLVPSEAPWPEVLVGCITL
jgi:hypothetical protein